jgi:hypothetical protein
MHNFFILYDLEYLLRPSKYNLPGWYIRVKYTTQRRQHFLHREQNSGQTPGFGDIQYILKNSDHNRSHRQLD